MNREAISVYHLQKRLGDDWLNMGRPYTDKDEAEREAAAWGPRHGTRLPVRVVCVTTEIVYETHPEPECQTP